MPPARLASPGPAKGSLGSARTLRCRPESGPRRGSASARRSRLLTTVERNAHDRAATAGRSHEPARPQERGTGRLIILAVIAVLAHRLHPAEHGERAPQLPLRRLLDAGLAAGHHRALHRRRRRPAHRRVRAQAAAQVGRTGPSGHDGGPPAADGAASSPSSTTSTDGPSGRPATRRSTSSSTPSSRRTPPT